jgi:hypothetical protein
MVNKIGALLCLAVTLLFFSFDTAAQGYVENALLFSSNRPGGSARILGLGGAQVALGGDFSSALSNPAGLGMYNRSEFTFSPAINTYSTDAAYFGNKKSDSKSVFNIPGLSYVYNMPRDKNGFLGGSFAISLTRTNDFHNVIQYEGINPYTSIVDYFIDQANGANTSQFNEGSYNYNTLTGLAYYNYLIGPLSTRNSSDPDDLYFTNLEPEPFPLQEEEIETKGASNQWSFSYGGNYQDKFFFGGGIGITTLRYKSKKTYVESFSEESVIEGFLFDEKLEIDGTGINATIGLIYRPLQFIQIGASLVTPTYYELTSNYFAEMYSGWRNYDYYGLATLNDEYASTDEGGVINEYTITTPLKFSAGVALFSEYGFITGDVEFINPSNAKYRSDIQSMTPENNAIKESYQAVANYRIGAEFRSNMFRLRGGYGSFGNPWKNKNIKFNDYYLSAGAGIKLPKFFLDFAYQSRNTEYYYFPYILASGEADPVNVKSKLQTFVFTVGFTF